MPLAFPYGCHSRTRGGVSKWGLKVVDNEKTLQAAKTKGENLEIWWQRWDKKLAFRTRERRKFWVFTDGPQRKEKKTSSEAMLRLNSASEKESVLLKEDQTDL
ncbi:hypothetical protein TNCV_1254271 [Trichonephila clavipes]|nr:hypothetical protein TNCV_1254271 [Trichonephila clavipes]